MKHYLFVSAASMVAVLSGRHGYAGEQTPKEELDRLQGVWRCAKVAMNGREVGFAEAQTMSVIFEGGKVVFAQKIEDGEEAKGPATPFRIDSARTPKEIDIGGKGEFKGIYSVEGDTLKLMHVLGKTGQPIPKLDRPKAFAPKAGDGFLYFECKRAKP